MELGTETALLAPPHTPASSPKGYENILADALKLALQLGKMTNIRRPKRVGTDDHPHKKPTTATIMNGVVDEMWDGPWRVIRKRREGGHTGMKGI